jgi:hypothetical protein
LARKPIIYRWKVEDHILRRVRTGEAGNRALAQADAVAAIKAIGRGLKGVQATVYRPSGGGWFARAWEPAMAEVRPTYRWESWEPADG